MYDVIIVDDKIEEIKDTLIALEKNHVRCFYSDGEEKNMPKNEKEKLPFKNVKYICLDFHLENRGITESSRTSVSTLAGVVKNFILENPENSLTIIVNSAFADDFKKYREDFKNYLKPIVVEDEKIIVESKKEKFSILHEKEKHKKEILKESIINTLRNLIIRESIDVENLIWEGLPLDEENKKVIDGVFNNEIDFAKKIRFFFKYYGDENGLEKELEKLRYLRNQFAHKENNEVVVSGDKKIMNLQAEELKTILYEKLKEIEDIKEKIKKPNLKKDDPEHIQP